MQLFRFMAAVLLVVLISLAGIAQESRHLTLTRAISLQQYRTDQLLERQANLRLRVHELTSPMRRPPTDVRPADAH
jgi:hypothetical protein